LYRETLSRSFDAEIFIAPTTFVLQDSGTEARHGLYRIAHSWVVPEFSDLPGGPALQLYIWTFVSSPIVSDRKDLQTGGQSLSHATLTGISINNRTHNQPTAGTRAGRIAGLGTIRRSNCARVAQLKDQGLEFLPHVPELGGGAGTGGGETRVWLNQVEGTGCQG
jgi:hypothetical protein